MVPQQNASLTCVRSWLWRCPTSLSIVVIQHPDQNQLGDERVYLAFTFLSQFIIKESQSRNLDASEELCFLVVLGCAWSAFLYNAGPPAQRWHRLQWAGPSSCLTDMSTGQLEKGNSPTEVLSSHRCQTDNSSYRAQIPSTSSLPKTNNDSSGKASRNLNVNRAFSRRDEI